jgi:serine/threonine protein kinase
MPFCEFSLDKKLEILKDNHILAIKIMMLICDGVNALHLSEIIHRDIKPKNILIDKNKNVLISDLGISKAPTEYTLLTSSKHYMGTNGFTPPEFSTPDGTKNATVKSDIYQLGKTFYNILTNTHPAFFEKDKIPTGLFLIVKKCTEDHPNDRYNNVSELKNVLHSYLKSLEPDDDPINKFENLILIAKDYLIDNTYDASNINDILNTLYFFQDDSNLFFKKFNELPLKLLDVIALKFNFHCLNLINTYFKTVTNYLENTIYNFQDADIIASRMYRLFHSTESIEVKKVALEMTLIAAVSLNRYSAMAKFDTMLKSIRTNDEAFVISEMLKENQEKYINVYDRIPSFELHTSIRNLQYEIKKRKEHEQILETTDTELW